MPAKRRRWLTLIGLLGPAYLWLLVMGFVPLFIMLYFSFLSDVPLGSREVYLTLENYTRFFSKSFYSKLTLDSLLMGAYTTLGCLIFGYPLAYALAKAVKGRWQAALFLLIIIPFWSNSLVRLYSWIIVLRNDGLLDLALEALGIRTDSGLLFTYPAIIIGLIHAYLPYMVLTIYIALDRIDDSLLDAAASLGARPLRTFTRVVFPLSLSGVISGVILVFIPAIGSFVEPRLLGGPAGTMLGTVIEDQFVQVFNWPLGAALSFILLVIVLAIMGISARVLAPSAGRLSR
ncbi:MAG TPA: ABC transporter permease [Chloroflexi bacterium]|nr:ABC transporter permease [Chloroflexota bacterium]